MGQRNRRKIENVLTVSPKVYIFMYNGHTHTGLNFLFDIRRKAGAKTFPES